MASGIGEVRLYHNTINSIPVGVYDDVTSSFTVGATNDYAQLVKSGLNAGTQYWFWVQVVDVAGNASSILPLGTRITSDITPPTINSFTIRAGSTATEIVANFAVTDNKQVQTMYLMISSSQSTAPTASTMTKDGIALPGSTTTYEALNLTPDTTYYGWLLAGDAFGNNTAVTASTPASLTTYEPVIWEFVRVEKEAGAYDAVMALIEQINPDVEWTIQLSDIVQYAPLRASVGPIENVLDVDLEKRIRFEDMENGTTMLTIFGPAASDLAAFRITWLSGYHTPGIEIRRNGVSLVTTPRGPNSWTNYNVVDYLVVDTAPTLDSYSVIPTPGSTTSSFDITLSCTDAYSGIQAIRLYINTEESVPGTYEDITSAILNSATIYITPGVSYQYVDGLKTLSTGLSQQTTYWMWIELIDIVGNAAAISPLGGYRLTTPKAFWEFFVSVPCNWPYPQAAEITQTNGSVAWTLQQSDLVWTSPADPTGGDYDVLFDGNATASTTAGRVYFQNNAPAGYKLFTIMTPLTSGAWNSRFTITWRHPATQPGLRIYRNSTMVLDEATNGGMTSTPSPNPVEYGGW